MIFSQKHITAIITIVNNVNIVNIIAYLLFFASPNLILLSVSMYNYN